MAGDRLTKGEPLAEQERWRQVFNLAQDLHCLAGVDGYFKQLNPAWEQLLGYSKAELMRRPYIELVHPEDVGATLSEAGRLAEGVRSVLFENRYRCKDGSYKWLEWRGSPASDGMIYGIARDISERKRHEKALKLLNEAAVEMSGVSDLDALGRILVRRAQQLFEADSSTASWADPDEGTLVLLADSRRNGSLPATRPLASGALGVAVRDAEPIVIDDYPSWPEALPLEPGRMPSSVMAVPLRIGERIVGGLAVASASPRKFSPEDVQLLSLLAAQAAPALELARLVQELQEANLELRRASEVKSQFLANMSHELRTPLNAILGFSELLIDEVAPDRETQRDYLQTIYGSGEHLLSLINDLLDLAKIEAGRVEVNPGELALQPLVAEVVTSLKSLAQAKQITVQNRVPESARLWADSRHVWQVLVNLLSNAIKFTDDGGRVVISSRRRGESTEIKVKDNGIGIAAEHLEVIFDEFAQVESGAARRQQGTGLGLALSRRLVALNGGAIQVTSQMGKGSAFKVLLPSPAKASRSRSRSRPRTLGAAGNGAPTVLVVDDDPAAVRLLTHHLRQAGYRTEVVSSGDEVVDLALSLRPAAITLDLLLPKLDGWEVLRALRAHPQTRDIPVVVVSIVDDQRRARVLGAVDFLVKPIDPTALISRLRALLGQGQAWEDTRVLIVDDDPKVLKLVDRSLSRAGLRVTTANGGSEGIRKASAAPPDAVILDLVMPEIDGFDVVHSLRQQTHTREIPILILTAKDLTEAEKAKLRGQVAAILQKTPNATMDLLDWIRHLTGR